MKAFIVTEGNKYTGFGHITRCTSLYQAFERKRIAITFIVNGDEAIKDLLEGKNYRVLNWLRGKRKLFNIIKEADMAIIDSYLADLEFYKRVSESVKIPVYLDDNKRLNYPKGIVISGTIYAEELNYPKKKDVAYLLGTKYIPLRREFWDVPKKEIKKNIESVMITFGGNDVKDITSKVVRFLSKNYPSFIKNVVIGKGFRNKKGIEIAADTKTNLFYHPDAAGMKKLMLESDIAISAGGQTLYELARVGTPTIAVAVADNQFHNIKSWQKAGFINYAGLCSTKDICKKIHYHIKALKNFSKRKRNSANGRRLVDGMGTRRIVDYICRRID